MATVSAMTAYFNPETGVKPVYYGADPVDVVVADVKDAFVQNLTNSIVLKTQHGAMFVVANTPANQQIFQLDN